MSLHVYPQHRVEYDYRRWEGEGDDAVPVSCPFDDASETQFVFTSTHPVDGHEFGMMLTVTPAVRHVEDASDCRDTAVEAMVRYMSEHPDGKDDDDE